MANVVVVAPHADDEILGCGGTIAKLKNDGIKIFVIIVTNAAVGAPEIFTQSSIENVRREALNAHACLGVEETIFLDFPAPALNAFPEYKITDEIGKIIKTLSADVLFLPHPGDLHQDHAAVYRASLVAARPLSTSTVKKILCYETLSETEWSPFQFNIPFRPNYFVDVNEFLQKKLDAFSCFHSQIKQFPHPRSLKTIEDLAHFRGATVGITAAEAFSVERIVR